MKSLGNNHKNRQRIRDKTKKLANDYDLKSLAGIAALTGFDINSKNSLECKTLITQEMLSNGFLTEILSMFVLSTSRGHRWIF